MSPYNLSCAGTKSMSSRRILPIIHFFWGAFHPRNWCAPSTSRDERMLIEIRKVAMWVRYTNARSTTIMMNHRKWIGFRTATHKKQHWPLAIAKQRRLTLNVLCWWRIIILNFVYIASGWVQSRPWEILQEALPILKFVCVWCTWYM